MAGIEPGTIHIPATSSAATATAESCGASGTGGGGGGGGGGEDVKGKRPKLPSFWIPTLTPNAKSTEIKKPVRVTK